MINQQSISREQWLSDRRKQRLSHIPVGRKIVKTPRIVLVHKPSSENLHLLETNKLPEVSVANIQSKTQINPFPFNRQHKSKVIYRNLGQPIVFPTYAGSKTFSHQAKNN
ncbi:MAG TPA: hypothetical protein VMQ58_02660 [Candidatus Saccharimonadales bacterium]|jgi:hypothetical protein|nr:hypothetical protein [Candidatus Saccharimonadales bacterium]